MTVAGGDDAEGGREADPRPCPPYAGGRAPTKASQNKVAIGYFIKHGERYR